MNRILGLESQKLGKKRWSDIVFVFQHEFLFAVDSLSVFHTNLGEKKKKGKKAYFNIQGVSLPPLVIPTLHWRSSFSPYQSSWQVVHETKLQVQVVHATVILLFSFLVNFGYGNHS